MPDTPKGGPLPRLEGEPYLVFDALKKLMYELLEAARAKQRLSMDPWIVATQFS